MTLKTHPVANVVAKHNFSFVYYEFAIMRQL